MGHTHAGTTEAKVYTVGADSGQPAFLGCFAWQEGDDIEKRWDEFSAEMWRWGLQPPEDEPAFSITEDGITYDHYYLVSVYDEDE